jgi:hypothetical protein
MNRKPWILEQRTAGMPWRFVSCYGTLPAAEEGSKDWKSIYDYSSDMSRNWEWRIRHRDDKLETAA